MSVPSQPLAEIQSMRGAIEAWSSATIAVISFSQQEMLKAFSSFDGPRLILLDCRFTTVEGLQSRSLAGYGIEQNIACLLTPMQICLLETSFDMRAIAIPVLSERSTWDPHLRPLYLELMTNIDQICASSILQINAESAALGLSDNCANKGIFLSYDLVGAVNEAVCEISNLVQELG